MAERHPDFDRTTARRQICELALKQANRFSEIGDFEAAKINLSYWRNNARLMWRLRRFVKKLTRGLFR
jgi:hypothetical protein